MTSWFSLGTIYSAGAHPTPRQLSDYLDEELRPGELRAIASHVRECDACSTLVDELRQAADLGFRSDDPSEPSPDLWPGIQSRLEPRPHGGTSVGRGGWHWWSASPGVRAGIMVAAALVVAVTATFTWLTFRGHDRTLVPGASPTQSGMTSPAVADQQYAETLAGLRREVHAKLTADPRLLDVIEENLATIDVAIANYRDALVQRPGDGELANRIAAAEQRKLNVLRQAAALAPGASD